MAETTSATPLEEQARSAIEIVTSALQNAVRQELDALRSSVQTHLVALDRVLSHEHMQPAFEPVITQLCQTVAQESAAMKADLEQRLAESDHRATESERRAAASERRADEAATRASEFEGRAAKADAAAAAAMSAKTDAERAAADVALQRDIAEAPLEGETHNRAALTAELEAARAQVLQARADVNALRLQLQRGGEGGRKKGGASASTAQTNTADATSALEQVRSALRTLTKASNAQHRLAAGIELLADSFARVAFCGSGPQGLTVWRSHGFDKPLQNRTIAIRGVEESPLARAIASGEPSTMDAAAGGTFPGLSGGTAGYAIALPVLSGDKQTMILYAENPPDWSKGDRAVAEKLAGIVADHLSYRLRKKQTANDAQMPASAPVRRARRLKVREGTTIDIDGSEGALVDVSTIGAQLLSTHAMKPNRAVKLLLPNENGGVACEARVVWSIVETNADHKKARYRAGVQFTEVDESQLEALFAQYGFSATDTQH